MSNQLLSSVNGAIIGQLFCFGRRGKLFQNSRFQANVWGHGA
ncbi:hypothetical protein ACFL34_03735 [Candidatus Sumerlaeota bacterium]